VCRSRTERPSPSKWSLETGAAAVRSFPGRAVLVEAATPAQVVRHRPVRDGMKGWASKLLVE
jgi:hypothetical protein